jgi:hypothetical protein
MTKVLVDILNFKKKKLVVFKVMIVICHTFSYQTRAKNV